MSTVRFFSNIPHIVRYGMHDDKDERSWIWFWRCGVRFTILADGKDFKDTDFYSQWRPLIREYPSAEQSMANFLERQWNPLCDLIISTSMPTLQRLAPGYEYWTTLRGYLHTPVYRLRLVASENHSSIETKVEEGPSQEGAYELAPASMDTFSLPAVLPTFQSSELCVLDMNKDWRQPPAKVCLKDGRVFSFVGCERGAGRGGRDAPIVNHSIDYIRARLEKWQDKKNGPEETQGVCGIVLDHSRSVSNSASKDGDPVRETDGQEQRVAGILLPWVSKEETSM
jgi:hypothetical protein